MELPDIPVDILGVPVMRILKALVTGIFCKL
jgi:hypothetical protein